MEKKLNQRRNADQCIGELQSNWLLVGKGLQLRIQEESIFILFTGKSFFTGFELKYIGSIAKKYKFNITGVGLNLDGELEVQLDPR